ncbi:MAG: hypothetical protein ABJE10_19135 [bacterium]
MDYGTNNTAPTGVLVLTASPQPVTVIVGGNATSTLTIARTNTAGTVALTVEGLPTGVTASFDPQSVTGNSSTLTLTASATATAGNYTITVRGKTADAADATVQIPVSITVAPGFTLTLGTNRLGVTQAGSVTTWIKATHVGGFTGAITYGLGFTPPGLAATLVSSTTPDSTTLIVAASAALTPGSYPLVIGTAGPGVTGHDTVITITVTAGVGNGARLFKSVISGNGSSCALDTFGIAYCWGLNNNGQLGNGATSAINSSPIAVAGGHTFESLAQSGTGHFVCGVATGGVAYCWGDNSVGQLGDGTTTARSAPTPVAGGLNFQSLSVGESHVCGVTHAFALYCWGLNSYGALGDGTTNPHTTPVAAAPGLTFKSVGAGIDYTCALTQAGVAYCWGFGGVGQLGNGDAANSSTPVAVSGGFIFNELAVAGLDVCGREMNGTVHCWGHNFYGEVGDGTTIRRLSPVALAGGHLFNSISAGIKHFCGVAIGGDAWCWGWNATGMLGDGSFTNRSTPVQVVGGFKFDGLGVGYSHACGVTTIATNTNEIYCWGANDFGQVGDGTTTPSAGPMEVRFP